MLKTNHQLKNDCLDTTRCIKSEIAAKVLQKILGHREISTTTDTYTDVYEKLENKFTK